MFITVNLPFKVLIIFSFDDLWLDFFLSLEGTFCSEMRKRKEAVAICFLSCLLVTTHCLSSNIHASPWYSLGCMRAFGEIGTDCWRVEGVTDDIWPLKEKPCAMSLGCV